MYGLGWLSDSKITHAAFPKLTWTLTEILRPSVDRNLENSLIHSFIQEMCQALCWALGRDHRQGRHGPGLTVYLPVETDLTPLSFIHLHTQYILNAPESPAYHQTLETDESVLRRFIITDLGGSLPM